MSPTEIISQLQESELEKQVPAIQKLFHCLHVIMQQNFHYIFNTDLITYMLHI
jgi:hypothetical protein